MKTMLIVLAALLVSANASAEIFKITSEGKPAKVTAHPQSSSEFKFVAEAANPYGGPNDEVTIEMKVFTNWCGTVNLKVTDVNSKLPLVLSQAEADFIVGFLKVADSIPGIVTDTTNLIVEINNGSEITCHKETLQVFEFDYSVVSMNGTITNMGSTFKGNTCLQMIQNFK